MLNVMIGNEDEKTVWDIDGFFRAMYEDDWLSVDYVKAMIKDVDNSELLAPHCVESPALGQIPPTSLSGGVKGLIWLLCCSKEEMRDYVLDLFLFGENCQKWLLEIGNRRDDVVVTCNTYDLGFHGLLSSDTAIHCLNDDSIITDSREWVFKLVEYLG